MRFKFILAIAIILCAFCILPVNAENIPLIMTYSNLDNQHYNVTNSNTAYVTLVYGIANIPNEVTLPSSPQINGYNLRVKPNTFYRISKTQHYVGDYCIAPDGVKIPYITLHAPATNETTTVTYTKSSYTATGTVTKTFTITYDFIDYVDPFENVGINYDITDITDNSVNYSVRCYTDSDSIKFSEIYDYYVDLDLIDVSLNAIDTTTIKNIGENGKYVYAWAMDTNSGSTKLLSVYLNGRNEIIVPTEEPTAQPTPDDDLSQYGEKKNFQIRNIDYLQGTQLNGANLTIYYTDSEDNIISNPVYKNVNSPAVIDLRVPKAGGLFVEYGITPNYEPVKVQTYPALNNKVGYWINQEITDYENLYYQYYDSNNPLTDINYGITLIDGNTHLPVSNAAINIDGANTQYTSNYGGTVFKNITQGLHTFTISKQGYNTLTFTKNIVITSSTEIEFFPISVIPTATITPSPITPITPSPTISPIDKPTSILESVSYGLAKVFGVKTVDNANYIFALLIILFPAAIAGGITHQALGFIAGGMLGFVFALTIGLIPIWTFFAMCLLAVIYIMLIRGNEGF